MATETREPRKLTREESAKWNQEVQAAYTEAFEQAKYKACENNNGSVKTECQCQHCMGAKAADKKAKEMARRFRIYDEPDTEAEPVPEIVASPPARRRAPFAPSETGSPLAPFEAETKPETE